MTRKYEKKQRAEREAETRRRIAAAAAGLHEEVGPAHTTIKEIAERAGVTRPTVYKHFPDEASLLAACSAHFEEQHPAPDMERWTEVEDPEGRLWGALVDVYDYYERTEAMTGHVMRDAETMPALREVLEAGWRPFVEAATAILSEGLEPRSVGGRRRLRAAIGLAIDFGTWRQLTRQGGLQDHEAVELMSALVLAAARD